MSASQRGISLHMTTRAASTQGRRSPLPMTTRTVGGEDQDQNRPAKVSRRSASHDDVHSSRDSSPDEDQLIEDAADAVAADGSESQLSDADVGIDPDDPDSFDAADGLEADVLQAETQETAADSGRSTPWQDGSRRPSPVKTLKLSFKPQGRTAKVASTQNGRTTEKDSPEHDEPGGILKRLPGRRRAPHPDLAVEVDLRRQLELKVAYRAVAKALKPILAELADRSAREMSENGALLEQYDEYDEIIGELDACLARRLGVLRCNLREEEDRLEREHQAKREILQERMIVSREALDLRVRLTLSRIISACARMTF